MAGCGNSPDAATCWPKPVWAFFTSNGDGVPLDRAEAYAWFTLAADQGEASALEAEAALSVELSEEELARAKERATRYTAFRKHP